MSCNEKINQYIEELEKEKIMMETQFAQLEQMLKDEKTKTKEDVFKFMSIFNTTKLQYEQLCADLISFIKIFNIEDKKEIRIYNIDELTELLNNEIVKLEGN